MPPIGEPVRSRGLTSTSRERLVAQLRNLDRAASRAIRLDPVTNAGLGFARSRRMTEKRPKRRLFELQNYSDQPKTTARTRERLPGRALAVFCGPVGARQWWMLLGGDRGGGAGVGRGRITRGGARTGPLDAMLDDATLERVTRDAEELSGFDDAPGGRKGFHAEQSFGGVKVPVFEDEAHGGRIGERSET